MNTIELQQMTLSARQVLTENILPYWLRLQDTERGGFYGQVLGDETVVKDAPRGAVLYARLLWTFSAAYRVLGTLYSSAANTTASRMLAYQKTAGKMPAYQYLAAAQSAKEYIEKYLLDREQGGVYWSVTADGKPLDTHKQFYAIAFMIYAYSEYYRATGDEDALKTAISLFECIEQHGRDRSYRTLGNVLHNNGGYIEAMTRDWQPITDMRLSEKDENTVKSQNTNLHVMEAYTNLYRALKYRELGFLQPQRQKAVKDKVKEALTSLIGIFCRHIMLPSGHLGLFFDEQWTPTSTVYSAGHDIECSWLIDEAAEVVGMDVSPMVKLLGKAAEEGLNADGSVGDGEWWNQAEAVVGYMNLYKRFDTEQDLLRAQKIMNYIQTKLIDHEHGEWYWRILPDGTPDLTQDKAGFWKCPYHNARMCLQIITYNS